MSCQRPLYTHSAIRRRWGVVPNHQGWLEVQRLRSLLETERARRMEETQKTATLQRELDNTKSELQKQKNLEDTFINKGKEMKRELPEAETFTYPETLSPVVMASNVHRDIRDKKKKLLQEDLEQLTVTCTCIVNKEAFMLEIKAEKERSDALRQELEQTKTRYQELRSKYEADIREGKLQVDAKMFYEEKLKQEQKRFENLRAEKDDLQQQLTAYQQMFSAFEVNHKTEVENLKMELQDRALLGPPRRKVAKSQVSNGEKDSNPVNNIANPAFMDLSCLIEETLSEDFEPPDASPEELSDFVEEMLRDSGILDFKPMEVTDLCVETLAEERESPDTKPVGATVGEKRNDTFLV